MSIHRKRINLVRVESDKVYDPSFDADAASSIAFYTTNMLPRKLLERPIREFYFICGSPVLPRNLRMRISARDELASDSEDSEDDELSSVTVQVSTVPAASSSSADGASDTPPHPPPFSKFMLTEVALQVQFVDEHITHTQSFRAVFPRLDCRYRGRRFPSRLLRQSYCGRGERRL